MKSSPHGQPCWHGRKKFSEGVKIRRAVHEDRHALSKRVLKRLNQASLDQPL